MFAIYNNNGIAENKGGPAGYLFNLKKGMDEINCNLEILSDFQDSIPKGNDTISQHRGEVLEQLRSIAHFFKKGLSIKNNSKNKWNEYNVLHIESSEDAFYLKRLIGYKGKIILSSHKPESLAEEKIGAINLKYGTKWKCGILKKFYNYIESSVYSFSDAFVFPSEGAEKIYYNFPGYKANTKDKPVKYVYTGCIKKPITLDRETYREKYNISEGKFVATYIGRHNYIKGYDLLVNIGPRLFSDDIQVVCAGPISSIEYPHSDSWLELGFITDVQNLINASDVVVIPNRNTYFDLVIIEILSMGKIVITSETGGNVDLAKETDGVVLFEAGNIESLYKAINTVKKLPDDQREKMENNNREFYEKNCSTSNFATNYRLVINELFDELGVDSQL